MKRRTDIYDGFDVHSEKRESRERPFDYNITVSCADLGAQMGMRSEADPDRRAMRNSLLANLALLRQAGLEAKIFYARANDAYARHRQYAPSWFTRSVVTQVIDRFVDDGWVLGHKTKPSRYATQRSTIWLTPKLTADLAVLRKRDFRQDLRNAIFLRDKHKQLIPYPDTCETRAMRRQVVEQNEALASVVIGIGDVTDQGLYLASNGRSVNTLRCALYRVFNRSTWELGGRYYGGYWQQLPKSDRANLTLDDASTFEHDISACHLRMAYARVGAALPQTDPYRLQDLTLILNAHEDVCRRLVKQAVLILINAETAPSAHLAIRRHLSEVNLPCDKAKEIIALIKASMPDLKPVWHSGIGLVLQRYDSDVAMSVMRSMRRKGVPVLPVHDSFIVPILAEQLLKEVVEREFDICLSKLRRGN